MALEREAVDHFLRLHADALVVDTCGPLGPTVYTPQMLARIDELATAATSTGIIIRDIEDMARRAIMCGELPDFWDRLEQSGVNVSVVTIGAFGRMPFSFEGAVRDLGGFTRLFESSDRIRKVTTAAEARAVKEASAFGIILAFQNATHIGEDLDNLDLFHDFGVRVIQLTYNERNLVGDGCTERNPGGLSRFGVSVVRRMNELGILVDTSHSSNRTTLDAVEVSERPTAVTHSFARGLHSHDRGKTDDVIRAIGESRGYFGVLLVPFFLTSEPEATLDHFSRHFQHVVDLAGAEHVGVGTDWGQAHPKPLIDLLHEEIRRFGFREEHRVDFAEQTTGFATWEEWPNITRALVKHGYSERQVRGFLGENFLRVFEGATTPR